MTKSRYKLPQLLAGFVTLTVLLSSLFFQFIEKMMPCPLCLMQRLCVVIMLILILLSFWATKKLRLISFLQVLTAIGGLFFSLRHLWLLSLPAGEAPACMPGLDTLIRYFPWQTVAHALLWGSGDCALESAPVLGLPMPGWSALYFSLMIILSLFVFFKYEKGHLSN